MDDRRQRQASEVEHRIQEELTSYWNSNPSAMDTLEGIATWWLPRHEARVGLKQIERALEQLEADGLIERTGDPTRPMFRLRIRQPSKINGHRRRT